MSKLSTTPFPEALWGLIPRFEPEVWRYNSGHGRQLVKGLPIVPVGTVALEAFV